MSRPRCPNGLVFGKDFDTDTDCTKRCMGACPATHKACAYDNLAPGPVGLTETNLLRFARICLNIPFDTFVRVAYGANDNVVGSRLRYLKGKYKLWEANPMKLICELDSTNLRTLAAYIQVKLDEGDR